MGDGIKGKYRTVQYLKKKGEKMKILWGVAAASAVCFQGFSAERVRTAVVGTNVIPLEIKFTNRIETFQNYSGRGFTNVEIRSFTPEGLVWWETGRVVSGRIPLHELSPETRTRLGVPEEYIDIKYQLDRKADSAKIDAYFAQINARVDAQRAAEDKKLKETAEQLIGPGMMAEKFTWTDVGYADVGLPWYGLALDEKRQAAVVLLMYARMTTPSCDLLVFRNAYNGAKVATFSPRTGFTMK